MKSTVAIALSGGTDSAVAALVLKSAGYSVTGIHLILNRDARSYAQLERAEEIARRIDLPFRVYDATDAFSSMVVEPTRSEYLAGRTPNPCVRCNRMVKFGLLVQYALSQGAGLLATGHYARIGEREGRSVLMRALDRHADQSYFLYAVERGVLDRVVFPLGSKQRHDVRDIAEDYGIEATPSQDICFDVQDGVAPHPGNIVDQEGTVIGRHGGLQSFTIGQRRGLGIPTGTPRYVVRIRVESNEVVVGSAQDLSCQEAEIRDENWQAGPPKSPEQQVMAQVRYRARPVPAHVFSNPGGTRVVFDEAQSAVAPGQSLVLYDGDVVLGGGTIEAAFVRNAP